MLDRFTPLPAEWRREAEVSYAHHDRERLGLQTRFDTDDDLSAFLEMLEIDPAPYIRLDTEVRARFRVSDSRWAKVGFRNGVAVEASQYFLLDPSFHYPVSTLRVFARRLGEGAHPDLERLLEPALAARETRWGLALKPSARGRRAAVFCQLSRPSLTAVLERLATASLLPASQAARVLELTERLHGSPLPYLTVDPADLSRIAVDVEDPTRLDPIAAWLGALNPRPPRYLKCRPAGDEVHWTAYYPWLAVRPPATDEASLDAIRAYYERTHDDYLAFVGPTLQAALIGETATDSNLALAKRAGLRAGMRVLDAGCGVCGPAIDIARALDVTIDAVTLSPSQAATARELISEAGLGERVRVHLADYHCLPFDDASFDAAVMLESSSYSHAPQRLFAEARRVLRPGGLLYVKDFFVDERPLTAEERRELLDYDFTYCTTTRTLADALAAMRAVGFEDARATTLPDASMAHFHQAMVEKEPQNVVRSAFLTAVSTTPRLTPFGRWHRRSWRALPVAAAEIRATSPTAPT